MARPVRDQRWVWVGRVIAALVLVALVVWFVVAGWDDAVKIATVIGVLVAVGALVAPYLFPPAGTRGEIVERPTEVVDSGKATAKDGGRANSGVEAAPTDGPVLVERSGDASADGPGSIANTGIMGEGAPTP